MKLASQIARLERAVGGDRRCACPGSSRWFTRPTSSATRGPSGPKGAGCNKSGTFTIADFGCFQAAFAAGCP